MVDQFLQYVQSRQGKNISKNNHSLHRLRTTGEKAKKNLAFSSQASIGIDSLFDGIIFKAIITRDRFEDLCMSYFERCVKLYEKVLRSDLLMKLFL